MKNQIPLEMPMGQMGQPPQMPVGSDELYASEVQEERLKNIVAQIAPDNQLRDLQWRIKGYLKNQVTNQWEKIDKDATEPSPLLVSRYISYLSSLLNQNTTLSNLSGGEINALMKLIIEWLVDDIDNNAIIYNLNDDYTERTRIGQILLNNTFLVLKRAQDGAESRRIFKALNVHESLSTQPQQGGFLDALKVWKK